jgi:hypothetical protein
VAVAAAIAVNVPFPFAVALALSSSLSLLPCPLLSLMQLLLPLPSPLPPPYQPLSFCHHCMLLLLINISQALPIGIPWMRQARTISFFMMVTRLPCIAHKLVLLKTSTMKYSAASWRARASVLCIHRLLFPNFSAILCTRRWKGAFLMRRSVFFWNFWISPRATVPGTSDEAFSRQSPFARPLVQTLWLNESVGLLPQ